MYKTTKVVRYTDLYKSCNQPIVQAKHKVKKERKHKSSSVSRTRKYYRWDEKIGFTKPRSTSFASGSITVQSDKVMSIVFTQIHTK